MPASRRDFLVAATAVGLVHIAQPVRAQSFPSKPVHIVVPFASGGTGDVLIRILVTTLEKRWGQPVIVEIKPGGGTVIANALVAKAPADGYTLLLISNSFMISAKLNKNLPYDGLRAFAPVAVLLDSPQVFAIGATSPHKTLKEWLDAARLGPGALSIGTFGPASSQHITTEMLKRAARVAPTYVPFPGGAPAVNALLGGHVDAVIANHSEVSAHLESGRLRALAVATPQRVELMKDVPTIAESGYPGFEVTVWFGIAAPASTPNDVVSRVADDFNLALGDPATRERLLKIGLIPAFKAPAAASEYIAQKSEQFSRVIDEAGIKIDN